VAVRKLNDDIVMKLGLHVPETSWGNGSTDLRPVLRDVVQAAEAAGFDLIAVADHVWLHPIMGGPEKNHVEAYTTLGFIAGQTERARLLAMATAASYRPAGLLAKVVTTLDVLSGGRAMLGIGAGDYAEEAEGLGLPFPASLGERFDVLEETISACLAMWAGDHGSDGPFEGRHVRLGRALNLPQSLARPHPPILIAGSGEKRTLPLVARFGDACNLSPRRRSRRSSTDSSGSATRPAATTTRSRRRPRSGSTWARTDRRHSRSSISCAGWPGWASRP
jgi:alkanesulfonate monooxygenase SsuD/methylene tetrahydromethanopterin reductase-like flavin-dependent oxidoreductase (luciferase family)